MQWMEKQVKECESMYIIYIYIYAYSVYIYYIYVCIYIYIYKEIDIYRCIDIYLRINNNRQQKVCSYRA